MVTPYFEDARGGFTKVFGPAALQAAGIDFVVSEMYWSRSHAGVVRGLHFQNPPTAVGKIVFVSLGRIRDVVLDLRAGSITYGELAEFELTERSGAVVVPLGCAHGFEVLSGPAITCYLQDGPYDPETDAGVRWDTAGIVWETTEPIVSERDRALPRLDELHTPFTVDEADHVR
jgi:dTDP-4-dehydrorhamnose 3,5-epimerase